MNSSAKVALFVSTVFLGLGIYLPFFPSWLLDTGYTANEIAVLLAVPMIARVVLSPYAVAVAGALPQRRQAAMLYTLAAFVSFLAIGFLDNFLVVLTLLSLFVVFWHALIPLGDSFALSEVRLRGANYGHIRLWGSIAFVIANLGAGLFLTQLGANGVFWLITLMLGLSVAASFLLPVYNLLPEERPYASASGFVGIVSFMRDPSFLQIALVAGLVQSSHALIYGFGTIDWQARGFTSIEIGGFWAIGVIAEILLFTQAAKLFSKMGARYLLLLGALAALVRWTLHGSMDSFGSIMAIQVLHGLSFGATHLGLQAYIAKHISEAETTTAQGAAVFVSGVLMAVLTLVCGQLYANWGLAGFYVMAFVCLLAALVLILTPKRRGGG